MLPRTYVVGGAPATWEQKLNAAVLWAGPTAAASGPSAAALWGFPGCVRGPVEVSHEGARQSRRGVVVRRVQLDPHDVTSLDRIRVTTAARTLADVAGRFDEDRFDAAFHFCLHGKLTTVEALSELVLQRGGPGFPGVGLLRDAVEAYSEGAAAASPLEAKVTRRLRSLSLPAPCRQHLVYADGRRRYLDFAWPDRLVALEVDGYRWHSSRGSWQRDRDRLAALRRAGWTIVHVTNADLGRFDDVARELKTLLH